MNEEEVLGLVENTQIREKWRIWVEDRMWVETDCDVGKERNVDTDVRRIREKRDREIQVL